MSKGASYRWSCESAVNGFVLVEVMVAAVLAAFVVGPLATSMQSLVSMAQNLRIDAANLSGVRTPIPATSAWEWGPAVETVVWDLGPEMRATVRPVVDGSLVVGAWADGWCVGEWETEGADELTVPASFWPGVVGTELILRVREPQGVWGPPWRCIVPDLWGTLPGEAATEAADGTTDGEQSDWEGAMVHVPSFAVPELRASWTTTPVSWSALGLSFALAPSTSGRCETDLGSGRQSWRSDEGRGLDVYF